MNTEVLRQWVADKTGLVTIWANANAPRPPRPYATVQLTSNNRLAQAHVGALDTVTGEAQVTGQRELTMSVQVYESTDNPDPRSAYNTVTSLRDALDLPSTRETFRSGGFAFRAVEMLQDTTALLDDHWQPRATFDMRLGAAVQQSDDLGIIETIAGTATVNGAETQFNTQEG